MAGLDPFVEEFRMLALDATMVLTVVSGLHYAWLVSRRGGASASERPGAKSNLP